MIKNAVKKNKAYYCLDCGKCSSVCPVSLLDPEYTPRMTVKRALSGERDELLTDELLWSCLTCKMCSERCQSDVRFAEFIRDLRIGALELGEEGEYSHSGMLQAFMRIMAAPDLRLNRLAWLPKDAKIAQKGDILYFVGCVPCFDAFFTDLDLDTVRIARGAVKILNHLGIEPVVLENERCCGHDLLWAGEVESFKELARENIEAIRESGAKTVLTSCAECYRTLKTDIAEFVGDLGVEVKHMSQFIQENLDKLEFKKSRKRVTYQDPCRLGRFYDVYDEPRDVIRAIEGVDLREMEASGKNALCCGTSVWLNCGRNNKKMQVDRLSQAKSTGADVLVTACPKCQIHFKCTLRDETTPEDARIQVMDLVSLVASKLK
jgi:Fe-S oxidoreductase